MNQPSKSDRIAAWHQAVAELETYWSGRTRPCPKCGTEFTSVNNLGTCPKCTTKFYASNPAVQVSILSRESWGAQIPDFPNPAIEDLLLEITEFDVERMTSASLLAISEFAAEHSSETFYAFSVDASMLCLNSEEEFQKTLAYYQQKYPQDYQTEVQIADLKFNTGDWAYQGFVDLEAADGFCRDLYSEHYDLGATAETEEEKAELAITPYARAVDDLLERLREADAFSNLRRTADFRILRVEHSY